MSKASKVAVSKKTVSVKKSTTSRSFKIASAKSPVKRLALPNIDLSPFKTAKIPSPTCGAISRGTGINKAGLGRVFRHRTCLIETGAKIAGYLGMSLDQFYSILTRQDSAPAA